MEVIQHGDCMIAPLLVVPNCTRYEIELKEKEFLKQYKDILVNKQTVLQTPEERKQQAKKHDAIFRTKHYDIINLKHLCDCGGRYTTKHKSTHEKTEKHLEYLKG